jgi:uncharacterized protein YhfF
MYWDEEIKKMSGWHFGGKGSGIEDSLLDLVLAGTKTATCSWYESYAVEGDPIPKVGERSYIMDSSDTPRCIIEVTSVEVLPFLEVDESFAYAEGEGDRSYAYWKRAHENFFTAFGKTIQMQWDSQTQSVVCERFKVVHRF